MESVKRSHKGKTSAKLQAKSTSTSLYQAKNSAKLQAKSTSTSLYQAGKSSIKEMKSKYSSASMKEKISKICSRASSAYKSKVQEAPSAKETKSRPLSKIQGGPKSKIATFQSKLPEKVDSTAIVKSHISSVGYIPSVMDNRDEVKEKKKAVQKFKGAVKYLEMSLLAFGLYFFVLGMLDYFYPYPYSKPKHGLSYFFAFGLIALVPVVGAFLSYFSMGCKSKCLLLSAMVANFIFLILSIIYLFVYLAGIKPFGFTREILFLTQVSLVLATSVALSGLHVSLLKQMGDIRVVAKVPTIVMNETKYGKSISQKNKPKNSDKAKKN